MTARKIAWHYTIDNRAVHILKDGIIVSTRFRQLTASRKFFLPSSVNL